MTIKSIGTGSSALNIRPTHNQYLGVPTLIFLFNIFMTSARKIIDESTVPQRKWTLPEISSLHTLLMAWVGDVSAFP